MQEGSSQEHTGHKSHRKAIVVKGYKSVARPGIALIALLLSLFLSYNPFDWARERVLHLPKGETETISSRGGAPDLRDEMEFYKLVRITFQELYPEYRDEFNEDKLRYFKDRTNSECGTYR